MARVQLASASFGVLVNNANVFIAGAAVTLNITGTSTPIPVFADATTGTMLSQPLTTDADGRIPGYADAPQTVDVTAVLSGVTYGPWQGELVRGDQTPVLQAGRLVLTQLPSHASTHSSIGADPITPSSIGAATAASLAGYLQAANNLSDIPSASTARTSLGLGTAATQPLAAFLQPANNLSDVADVDTARANVRVPSLRSCKAVATANVALTGLQTIDGYTLLNTDRVLLTAQTTASQNGPWVAGSGAWTRPNDYPSGGSIVGRTVLVDGGGSYARSFWVTGQTAAVTIDTTSTTWTQIGAGAAVFSVFGRTGPVLAEHGDYTYKFRSLHSYAVPGSIAVPSGASDPFAYLPPFFVSLGANETVQLVKVRSVLGSGTSATLKLQKNGGDITGFTGFNATTTAASNTATAVSLVEDDMVALVVTAVSGSPVNLSATIVLEHTVT